MDLDDEEAPRISGSPRFRVVKWAVIGAVVALAAVFGIPRVFNYATRSASDPELSNWDFEIKQPFDRPEDVGRLIGACDRVNVSSREDTGIRRLRATCGERAFEAIEYMRRAPSPAPGAPGYQENFEATCWLLCGLLRVADSSDPWLPIEQKEISGQCASVPEGTEASRACAPYIGRVEQPLTIGSKGVVLKKGTAAPPDPSRWQTAIDGPLTGSMLLAFIHDCSLAVRQRSDDLTARQLQEACAERGLKAVDLVSAQEPHEDACRHRCILLGVANRQDRRWGRARNAAANECGDVHTSFCDGILSSAPQR